MPHDAYQDPQIGAAASAATSVVYVERGWRTSTIGTSDTCDEIVGRLTREFAETLSWRSAYSAQGDQEGFSQRRFRIKRGHLDISSRGKYFLGAVASGRIKPMTTGAVIKLRYRPTRSSLFRLMTSLLLALFATVGFVLNIRTHSGRAGPAWGALFLAFVGWGGVAVDWANVRKYRRAIDHEVTTALSGENTSAT